jgi:hypothetical protein
MKINHLETHDRLLHFKKDQEANLAEGFEECRLRNKDCLSMQKFFPYVYIFAHPRTTDDGITKKMIWQPRLTKPLAQENSYLFRLISNTDLVEIIWMLPPRELWDSYIEGKMMESMPIAISIQNYLHAKRRIESPHPEDWPEDKIRATLEVI